VTQPKRSKGVTAEELLARLAKDKGYQTRKATRDASLQERVTRERSAEQPIIADLRRSGIDITTVWDFVNTWEPYHAALPVLLEHFETGGYPDMVMEGLGRALAVKPSVVFWARLKACYLSARGPGQREGAAVALAACATAEHTKDLIQLIGTEELGNSRIYFIQPLLRVGGERGRRVVEKLRGDPVLGKEATALVSGRGPK